MKAVRFFSQGEPIKVVEIDKPKPEAGQILLKVTAAGICHSDIMITTADPAEFGKAYPPHLPLTLGHEGAGIVEEVGFGVDESLIGRSFIVYGAWGCGMCHYCSQGKENYCQNAYDQGIYPPGLGSNGALAEYMLVDDQRHLVEIGDTDPVQIVPLTDAGLTPYHAIVGSLPKLKGGSIAVVIGVGGLGHLAVQLVKALSAAEIIAVDVEEEKLQLARKIGADHTFVSNKETADKIMEYTQGRGVDVVFDIVGINPTLATAAAITKPEGDIVRVGMGGGTLEFKLHSPRHDVAVRAPYWGSRSELTEVVEMSRRGQIKVSTETFSIDDATKAYELLKEGKITGRAVIVP